MTTIKLLLTAALAAMSLSATAQADERDVEWVNVTVLHHAASGSTDRSNTLQQYLLLDNAVAEQHPELNEQLEVFREEYSQKVINQVVPEAEKLLDESLEQLRKVIKEHPELAGQLKEQLKEAEAQRGKLTAEHVKEVGDYTYQPADILKALTAIAINKRAYAAYKDLGNGLYAVLTGTSFGPVDPDAFNKPTIADDQKFTWGVMNRDGHMIIEPKYAEPFGHPDNDFIILRNRQGGKEMEGAKGYDGRQIVPFVYTSISYHPFGLCVSKDGQNYGLVDHANTRQLIPMKYRGVWSNYDDTIKMSRPDGQLDVYDANFKLIRTEPDPN